MHILGEFVNAEGDTPTTPVRDTPTTPVGDNLFEDDIPDPPPYPPEAETPVGETPTTPVRDTSTPLVRDTPTTPVRVPEEIHAIDQLPVETLNYIDCIINTNIELNEINFLNELPEFQIIDNVRN